jgi:hypothetical protein
MGIAEAICRGSGQAEQQSGRFFPAEVSVKQNLIPNTTEHGEFRFSCILKSDMARAASDVKGVNTVNLAKIHAKRCLREIMQWPSIQQSDVTVLVEGPIDGAGDGMHVSCITASFPLLF